MMSDVDKLVLREAVNNAQRAIVMLHKGLVNEAESYAIQVKMTGANVNSLPSPVASAYYRASSISSMARSNPKDFILRMERFITAAKNSSKITE